MADRKDYRQIEEMVVDYKENNDQYALEKIIESFDPLFVKYIRILKNSDYNLDDKDTRSFVSLFINSGEARSNIRKLPRYMDSKTKKIFKEARNMINHMCNNIDQEDLKNEFICITLKMLQRYEIGTNGFCAYMNHTFKFEVFRRVSSITMDPLVHKSDFIISFYDENYINNKNNLAKIKNMFVESPQAQVEYELDSSWIRGATCGEAFEGLSPVERQIIKLKYVEGETDISIGDRLGICRNTVRRRREKAVDKIKENIKSLHYLEE